MENSYKYKNLPIDERVEHMLSKMTLVKAIIKELEVTFDINTGKLYE